MRVACIALSAIVNERGEFRHGAIEGIERLVYYGYKLVVETDRVEHATSESIRTLVSRINARFDCSRRGSVSDPDVIFDNRVAGWKGWRVVMVEVDEANRAKHDEWKRAKALSEKPPVACSIDEPDDCPS